MKAVPRYLSPQSLELENTNGQKVWLVSKSALSHVIFNAAVTWTPLQLPGQASIDMSIDGTASPRQPTGVTPEPNLFV